MANMPSDRRVFGIHGRREKILICQHASHRRSVWWPDGFAERMAEIATQTVALMSESCAMASDESVAR